MAAATTAEMESATPKTMGRAWVIKEGVSIDAFTEVQRLRGQRRAVRHLTTYGRHSSEPETVKATMAERKQTVERPYPPDYVSAETLAYRLDCSRSTIDTYVRDGLLPKPEMVGNLQRWDFALVVSFIKARNNAPPHISGDDPHIKGIRRAPTA